MGAHLRTRPTLPRSFRWLLGSAWVSNAGDGVRNAVLPLVAAGMSVSTTAVTVVAAATTLPFALFGIVAGTLADRCERRRLIAAAHLFRGGVVLGLAALLFTDGMTQTLLVGCAFLLGVGEAVADSAAPALVPDLVDDDELERANSELETAELVANDLVGPPIGSLLYVVTPGLPFLIDALSFTSAAALVRGIGRPDRHAGPEHDAVPNHRADPGLGVELIERATWRADLREGITTAWTNRVLRVTGALIVLVQLGNLVAVAPIVVYVTDDLGLDPGGYGLFLASGSVGGIVGSRLARRAVLRLGSFATVMSALATVVVAFALMLVRSVPFVAVGFSLSFGAVVVGRIVVLTARQRSVPSRLLGRAQGAMRTLVWGAATIGAILGGVVADQYGSRAPFLAGGAFYVVAIVTCWRPLRSIFVEPADPAAETESISPPSP